MLCFKFSFQTEARGFVMDEDDNILIYCPSECALDAPNPRKKLKLEMTRIKPFVSCNHSRELQGVEVYVKATKVRSCLNPKCNLVLACWKGNGASS